MAQQTFYIYPDNGLYDPPADRADVPLTLTSNPDAGIVAWGGALWGWIDLSDRPYCVAWAVGQEGEFDEFLANNGFKRTEAEE